jgi:predicted transcriptional regulator
LASSEPSCHIIESSRYSNTLEKQESDLKSHFMMMIEDIKNNINNYLKEETQKSLKELQENTTKQVKELNKKHSGSKKWK